VVAADAGSVVLAVAGALIGVVAVADLFLTIFNYDGYTTLTTLFHRAWWRLVRLVTRPLPERARHVALSVGSATMLPATVALWLGLEITAFALLYDSGFHRGGFVLRGATATIGTAFYLSAGAISSLTFGDVLARGAAPRALVDLETIVGLATFTLGLGYVVTAFDILGRLENLHGRVRRHAEDLERPESIISRHFRGGAQNGLPSFLQSLSDDLESYDQGLRRYPVVYFFHTRRTRRSIPHVFGAIGDLVALLRWGLAPSEPLTKDPFLAALHDVYVQTLDRLRRNFVGPDPIRPPAPLDEDAFEAAFAGGGSDPGVEAFRRLQQRGRDAAAQSYDESPAGAYERYREWLPFAHMQRVVLDRVADRLGYPRPAERASSRASIPTSRNVPPSVGR
jgi:hypothetical protein